MCVGMHTPVHECVPTNTHKRLDWMFAGIRATVEKHFRRGRLSNRRLFRRMVFSRIYYRYGKQLLAAGEPGRARGCFYTALGFNPLYLRAVPRILAASRRVAPTVAPGGAGPDPIERGRRG